MRLSSAFKLSGALLVAGVLFGVGERIGQWLLPAPDTRVVLCVLADDSDEDSCVPRGAAEHLSSDDEAGPVFKSPQVRSI
ncbi:hypothetical protein WJ96_07520 [Burkholderia ubonensis]|uniref:Uncharacterized protein n=1 Tax=Burkholderia ubonensis TaxID=101571 RepID=A0AAW3MXT4_9BURK|nr:hypothetical protein WJ93_09310 [Burkholderia ubonensis]KVP98360.1 hypothetical protein WJ96_07520 [Burkholderia ubonensis]